ncbi:uncharacterized protein LOC110231456 [Rhizophagus irregularis DAOM 181602=DAOM 197198]|nr:uncharacterized protein LOC110231456 [Rhizophagus irregularis DAOM 181602=DAOM 197198]
MMNVNERRVKTRTKEKCYCNKCNGKYVDPRTKQKHSMSLSLDDATTSNDPMSIGSSFVNEKISIDPQESTSSSENLSTFSSKRRKRSRYNTYLERDTQMQNINDSDDNNDSNEETDNYGDSDDEDNSDDNDDGDDGDDNDDGDNSDDGDDNDDGDDSDNGDDGDDSDNGNDGDDDGEETNIFEDYSPPNYDFPNNINENLQNIEDWIIVFVLRYQTRFRLADTAIDTLIKFIKHILTNFNYDRFKDFPTSLYTARKKLGLKHQFVKFSVCPSCHKLHNIDDVKQHTIQQHKAIKKCGHVQFPNHRSLRQCNAPLSEQKKLDNGKVVNAPLLIYPMPSIKEQLLQMYQRPNFEKNLKLWANRSVNDRVLCDIYDGEIWKNFSNSGIIVNDESDEQRFFNKEHADDHLGIMINVDWFQPFERTIHSSGAIYGAICNLPRELRFKPENMLILGLMPGPNEPSLHQINHYLAPIVDQFQTFWEGVGLDRTSEHLSRRLIKCAVIACCCDIPAARKLCGHYSANVSCHRCLKVARNRNFSGMDDIDEWFVAKSANSHREMALEWRKCKSNEARKRHAKQYHARWSEMLRLSYFDLIRFLPMDPMHNLFIGIASFIVKRLWLGHSKINMDDLTKIQKNMNNIHPPSEIGRIPHKIDIGKGFSNLTANEWKNFFLIYARVVLWDFLDQEDQKILVHFSQAYSILVRRIVTIKNLDDAHEHLIEILKLIETNYGEVSITPNLHLSLHLNKCCKDYGSLYSFWYFSFERMNGILDISEKLVSGRATGTEEYPGELLSPIKLNVILPDDILDLLVDYYNRAYEEYNFSQPRLDPSLSTKNYIAVTGNITQCGRLRIGAEYFGSILSKRYIRSSYILARFIEQRGNDIDTYSGQVQFYFKHTVHLPNGLTEHYLAFVNWYKPAATANIRFFFSSEDSDDFTNDPELWKKEFFNSSIDSIIPVHHILGRFVPAKFKYKRTEYLAILPLNGRFHI